MASHFRPEGSAHQAFRYQYFIFIPLIVPTLQAGIRGPFLTQAFDLGCYVAPLQGLLGRKILFVSLSFCLFVSLSLCLFVSLSF